MSGDKSPGPIGAPSDPDALAEVSGSSHKSYRRKYRKIMVTFEENMRQSNNLFKDEQRILGISRRLAEQNDLLLQLLEDLNSCPQIPASLRYDASTSSTNHMVTAKADLVADTTAAREALQEARSKVRRREMTEAEYAEIVQSINEGKTFAPRRSYMSLIKIPHRTANKPQEYFTDAGSVILTGCLTAKEEEQYLNGLTSYLDGKSSTTRPHAAGGLASERAVEREREMQLRNPVSVYNWLRKHQPGVFLQDHEGHGEKVGKPAASRSSKRSLGGGGPAHKHEHDLYDDDGIAADMGSAMKGKRKRDDDPGYRPKGGASRPLKRKKDDSFISSKRGKKGSISNL